MRLSGFEFQPELFLDGGVERRGCVWGIAGRGRLDAHAAELRIIRRPLQEKIPFTAERCLVDYRPVQHG